MIDTRSGNPDEVSRSSLLPKSPAALLSGLKTRFGGFGKSAAKDVTTITMELGFIKVLVTRGMEVLDYRVALANPQFYREGLVSDPGRASMVLRNALSEMDGQHQLILGAIPGYQNTLGRIELPKAPGLDPAVVIPREASRSMGISPETSFLTWYRLRDNVDRMRWLVISANRRSITSYVDTLSAAELSPKTLELRPFALARAVGIPDVIIAWAANDGGDVVIVKDWVPVAHQGAYWGTEPVERDVLVDRLTAVVDQTIAVYEEQNLDTPVADSTRLVVTGSPVGVDQEIPARVAQNLNRQIEKLSPPLATPVEFPIDDLVINVGLALWEA